MSSRSLSGRFSGFFGIQLASMLAPFAALPVLARVAGPEGWISVGVGQAVGSMMATVILFGWGVVGPARLAQDGDSDNRLQALIESLQARLLVAVPVVIIGALVTGVVARGDFLVEAVVIAAATSAAGFSTAWYAVGVGRPRLLAVYELVPRLTGTGLGLVALVLTGNVICYAFFVGVAPLIANALLIRALRARRTHMATLRAVIAGIKAQLPVVGSTATAAVYTSAPVLIAAMVADTASAAALISGDKLFRFSLFTIIALANTLQSWVLTPRLGRPRRVRQAQLAHAVLGIVGGGAIAGLGPFATALLFGSDVAAPLFVTAAYGVAFLFSSLGTPMIRNVLIPRGSTTVLFASTVTAAATGIFMMFTLARTWGVAGVAWGYAASEVVALVVIVIGLVSWRRSARRNFLDGDGD